MKSLFSKRGFFKLMVTFIIYVVVIYFLGYRLPWFDKHPGWQEFPYLTNKKIVIKEIENFNKKYGNKYKLPKIEVGMDSIIFEKYYKNNLKNIKSIGFTVTDNKFEYHGFFEFRGLRGGGNSTGINNNQNLPETGFIQSGIEYLEFSIGNEKGYFKSKTLSTDTSLKFFYQYNSPKKESDTLFFRYDATNYKAYIK